MMLKAEKSLLLVIDIQEKLFPLQAEKERFIQKCSFILEAAKLIGVKIEGTEQYPKGLGHTLSEIAKKIPNPLHGKTLFSAFKSLSVAPDTQILLCGMEAHICVLQTALDFKAAGFDTYLIVDAITARNLQDKDIALTRLLHEGIKPLTTEMVVYEWMKDSNHPQFRNINTLMKNK